jgi:N-methylhydantoinase B
MQVIYMTDGSVYPAPGARGGGHGSRAGQLKRLADGSLQPEGPTGPVHMEPGESIVALGPGGGGYGPPWERDLERVRKDVVEEWISRERAENVYGVIFTDELEVDLAATQALRDRMTAEAGPYQPAPAEILTEDEIRRRTIELTKDLPEMPAKDRWW